MKHKIKKLDYRTWNYRGYVIKRGLEGGYGILTEEGDLYVGASTLREMVRIINRIEKEEKQ